MPSQDDIQTTKRVIEAGKLTTACGKKKTVDFTSQTMVDVNVLNYLNFRPQLQRFY